MTSASATRQEFDPVTAPLTGTILVEANAGTGKTHAIALTYLRLLLERGLSVERVALVTFTELAARELRERVLGALRALDAVLDTVGRAGSEAEQHLGEPALRPLLARIASTVAQDDLVTRVHEALLRFDETRISTIHGFCRRLLIEFGARAGIAVPQARTEAGDAARAALLRDFWRREIVSGDVARARWVVSWCEDVDSLHRALAETYAAPRNAILPAAATLANRDGQSLTLAYAKLTAFWKRGAVTALFAELRSAPLYRSQKSPYAEAALAAAEQSLERFVLDGDGRFWPLDALAPLALTRIAEQRTQKGLASGWLPRATELAAWVDDTAPELAAEMRAMQARFLLDARDAVLDGMVSRRECLAQWTHDDLIEVCANALEGDSGRDMAARIARSLDAVVVDEFQDTEARQYGIFRRIAHGRESKLLMLVGDPKQAIYRFRGGDVYAYRAAVEDATSHFTLTMNWRSSAALVTAINALFGRDGLPDPFELGFIGYRPSTAASAGESSGKAITALRLIHLPVAEGKPVWSKEALARAAIDATVGAIAEWQRDHPGARVAVLALSNRQCEAMQRALQAAGIAARANLRASVFASAAANDLTYLFAALDPAATADVFRAALATPTLGEPIASLIAARENPDLAAALESLRAHWAALLSEQGAVALVRALLAERGPRWLAEPEATRRATDLLQLAEAVAESSASEPAALAHWLSQRAAAAAAMFEDDDARRWAEAGEGAVEVLTVHRAKGLQWEAVFVPFLWETSSDDGIEWRPVKFHDGNVLRFDFGSRALEANRHRSLHEQRLETTRLAYVALTRAKLHCSVVCARTRDFDASPLARTLDPTSVSGDESCFAAGLERLRATAPNAITLVSASHTPAVIRPRKSDASRLEARVLSHPMASSARTLSFSAIAGQGAGAADHDSAAPDRAAGPVASAGPIAAQPRGARAGECLHAALERIEFAQWPQPEAMRPFEEACLRFRFAGEERAVLADWIDRTVDVPLFRDLSLRRLPPSRQAREIEFHFSLDAGSAAAVGAALALDARYRRSEAELARLPARLEGTMHGFIDLVLEHDGRWFVLDYKSNFLGVHYGDYRADALAAAIRAGDYDLQYLIYLVALMRQLRHRLGSSFDPERHLGGALYLFVRGLDAEGGFGIHRDRPPQVVLDALDRAFAPAVPA
jgi:exodeoxyribonuclease V beta subunit